MTSPPPRHLLRPWRLALRAVSRAVPPALRSAWLAEWHAELWFAAHTAAHTGSSSAAQHTSVARFCLGALADAHCLRRLNRPDHTDRADARNRSNPHAFENAPTPPPRPTPFPGLAPPAPATLSSPHAPVPLLGPVPVFEKRSGPRLSRVSTVPPPGSPTRCLATLAALALTAFVIALASPVPRALLIGPQRHTSPRVVRLSPSATADSPASPLRLATVQAWQRRSQHLFSRFVFVAPARKAVHIDLHHTPELTVALASRDLLRLIDDPGLLSPPPPPGQPSPAYVASQQETSTAEPVVYLSETTWRTHFAARPGVLGAPVRVGLTSARIAGVLPNNAIPLGAPFSQPPDLWIVLSDTLAARLPSSTLVFALGQLAPAAEIDPATLPAIVQDRWHLAVPGAPADDPGFDCISLAASDPHPWRSFLFTLFLAVVTLPALTPLASLTQGDVPPVTHLHPISALRRHLFLAAKLILILPMAYLGALDLAAVIPAAAEGTQLLLSFLALLVALHWALRDQRHRCPTCLRTLSCPARVGQPSRNFLSWNGTELICTGGHGLLHVPELPTSWFSRPRWLHLDSSWRSLFLPA